LFGDHPLQFGDDLPAETSVAKSSFTQWLQPAMVTPLQAGFGR
jgi:hypothetical protein